jgi:acyl-homoserine-lactone acylase
MFGARPDPPKTGDESPIMDLHLALRLAAVASLLQVACAPPGPSGPQRDEILWDTWGVPHVYGTTDEAVFRGQGWAQMESHGDLVLRLYGRARGRAAEYWGGAYLDSDRWVRSMDIPARGERWLNAQSPDFRRNLEAFARGMNDYAAAHPELLDDDAERVLPVTAADVLAHGGQVLQFSFITNPGVVRQAQGALSDRVATGPLPAERASGIGSNAWAVGPSRSASGNAMLLANPHLPWGDLFLFWESHLVGPGTDVYGVTLVGLPGVAIGFNDRLGWTHTVNTYDGADLFVVEKDGDGYRFGDELRGFGEREEVILVRPEGEGAPREERLTVRATVHGPVVAENTVAAVALRVAGEDAAGAMEEWWDMGRARDLEGFEGALKRLQIPMFNVLYADADRHVFYLYNGLLPRRSSGDVRSWLGAVDGSDPSTLWTGFLDYGELPRVLDPAVGWLQNANDPPWTSTVPETLDAGDFPPYLAMRSMHFRAQRSALMLMEDESITFEELVAYKHSTRMAAADRVVDDLVAAARAADVAQAVAAADVLAAWDRTADAQSRGGVLFLAWLESFVREGGGWANPWSVADPVGTPNGIADPDAAVRLLAKAAASVEEQYGAVDVRWGEVHGARVGAHEVEASGASGDPGGVFRVASYADDGDHKRWVTMGDSYYSAMEFTPGGVKARVLLAYGNATQPHSTHVGDQLELYGRKEMRTPWRTRAEIEANLEKTVTPSSPENPR